MQTESHCARHNVVSQNSRARFDVVFGSKRAKFDAYLYDMHCVCNCTVNALQTKRIWSCVQIA